jgi:hypothetical protein
MQGGGFFYPSPMEQRRREKDEIWASGGFYIHSLLYKESKTSEMT